jgi:hypothetical protein
MTYTPKPGTGALFKNERKERDIQPDYKGSLTLPDGTTMQLAAGSAKARRASTCR